MTPEEFFNQSQIDERVDKTTRLRENITLEIEQVPREAFLGLEARIGTRYAAVYDGDKLVASTGPLIGIVVDPEYRGRGIASELIYRMVKRNPGLVARAITGLAGSKRPRTTAGDAAYKAAWRKLSRK